jgi:hypothetical protein
MPWVTAGTRGRVAVVWYGTADSTHNPSTEDAHQPWDVYVASITDAATATPSIRQTKVTRHPMHYGTICLEGTGCITVAGNRNLADFFQVTADPRTGAIVITYDDTSNENAQEFVGEGEGTLDHRGAPVVMVVRQNGGVGLFGRPVTGAPRAGRKVPDRTGDAHFDPVYGTTDIPELDLLQMSARATGQNIDFTFHVKSLDDYLNALTATGAGAIEYVARWTGPPIDDPTTGIRNPIYYVAVEVEADGTPHFFAGQAISVELCSVSGCFPHLIDYPEPPRGGATVSGELRQNAFGHDHWIVHVPRELIGFPPTGSVTMESFSAYALARPKSASLEFTNVEAEGDISPIEVDGACCREVTLQVDGRRPGG